VKALVAADAVTGLLVALANSDYADSKKHAVECIKALTRTSREADDRFLECTGQTFYQRFQADPAGCAATLDSAGLDRMLKASGVEQKSKAALPSGGATVDENAVDGSGGGAEGDAGAGGGEEAGDATGNGQAQEDWSEQEGRSVSMESGEAGGEGSERGGGGGTEWDAEEKEHVGVEREESGESVAAGEHRVAAPELSAADTYAEASAESIGYSKAQGDGEEGARDEAAVDER